MISIDLRKQQIYVKYLIQYLILHTPSQNKLYLWTFSLLDALGLELCLFFTCDYITLIETRFQDEIGCFLKFYNKSIY